MKGRWLTYGIGLVGESAANPALHDRALGQGRCDRIVVSSHKLADVKIMISATFFHESNSFL
jgi:hypothetical protein